ncbi:MAG: hypothetical protein ACTS2F_23925 [Thainema sp.]
MLWLSKFLRTLVNDTRTNIGTSISSAPRFRMGLIPAVLLVRVMRSHSWQSLEQSCCQCDRAEI